LIAWLFWHTGVDFDPESKHRLTKDMKVEQNQPACQLLHHSPESKLFPEMFHSQSQKVLASVTFFRLTSFSGNSRTGEEIEEAAV
jgi:hypothetical protein